MDKLLFAVVVVVFTVVVVVVTVVVDIDNDDVSEYGHRPLRSSTDRTLTVLRTVYLNK